MWAKLNMVKEDWFVPQFRCYGSFTLPDTRPKPIQILIKRVQHRMEVCIGLRLCAIWIPPHNFYQPQGKVMFSQVSVCSQSAPWILVYCSALWPRSRYASYWNAFLYTSYFSSVSVSGSMNTPLVWSILKSYHRKGENKHEHLKQNWTKTKD